MKRGKFGKVTIGLLLATSLVACGEITEEDKQANINELNPVDAAGLNDVMLNLADPDQAVAYFREALANEPDRIDLKRSLAEALVRAGKYAEAALVFEQIIDAGQATSQDRIDYAEALIRNGAFEDAEKQLDAVPPTVETFDRYFLEALVADHNEEWEKADNYYDIARGLTTRPAQVLNNWGISKLNRGQLNDAEKLFKQAIAADPELFTAKNNLVISRAKQGIYKLPVIPMNDRERAILLYNIAREAIKNGDIDIAKGLLAEAIDTHPQHFEAAVALLESL